MVARDERTKRIAEMHSKLQELLGHIDRAPEIVQYTVFARLWEHVERVNQVLSNAETPMEQILGIYLDLYVCDSVVANDLGFYTEVRQQERIEIDDETYQVAFLLWAEIPTERINLRMAVECVSSEALEGATKVKLEAKERAFKAAGIPFVRCTAAEIHKEPFSCAINLTQKFEALLKSYRAQAN